MNWRAFLWAAGIGLALQVLMVVSGHFSPAIGGLFAVGGMGFSLVAGLLYAYFAKAGWRDDLIGGVLAGAACALVGIGVSCLLGDVPASLLLLGTASSAVTGALGGAIGRLAFG